MGGEQAAGVLAQVRRGQIEGAGETWSEQDEQVFKQPILDDLRLRAIRTTPVRDFGMTASSIQRKRAGYWAWPCLQH